jgi:hypothetical protein
MLAWAGKGNEEKKEGRTGESEKRRRGAIELVSY